MIKVFLAVVCLLFSGCKYSACKTEYYANEQKANFSSQFNQETYVWENFQFPTNRTSGAQ